MVPNTTTINEWGKTFKNFFRNEFLSRYRGRNLRNIAITNVIAANKNVYPLVEGSSARIWRAREQQTNKKERNEIRKEIDNMTSEILKKINYTSTSLSVKKRNANIVDRLPPVRSRFGTGSEYVLKLTRHNHNGCPGSKSRNYRMTTEDQEKMCKREKPKQG